MGTQKPVVIGEKPEEIVGGPIAEHHGKKSKIKDQKSKIKEKIKEGKFQQEKAEISEEIVELEKKASAPAKQEAKSADLSAEALAKAEEKAKPKKKVKVGKTRVRSKKYQAASALIDHAQKYNLVEALDLVKKTTLTKFDGNVEVHIRLLSKTGKPEIFRGMIKYPHTTGKSVKIVILDEKVALEIEKTGKAEADIYVTTPAMMPKIAKLAKILGPKGKMPNPKSGTVTDNPEKVQKELASGQVEYKSDQYGNIHQIIGKVSVDSKKLEENFMALISALPRDRITSASLCATMGPGIKVQV